jgi:cytochrome bd ubiquinol oxidase subunit II
VSTIAAVLLWSSVTCYAVLGGADYGAGFWDLTAGGARRGARPRALIDRAMAPVWEANNVWLILALVVLWTAFPRAFASIMSALFVPMSLAAAGIVLRGSAFVFRKPIQALTGRRLFGAAFALSSLLTPFFLGTAFGAVASGRVQAGDRGGDAFSAWIGPTPMLIGVFAVVCAALLAAVFLVFDARKAGDELLERYFRRRVMASAAATGVVATAGLFVLRSDAPFMFHGLLREGLPFVLISGACGVALLMLVAHRIALATRGLAIAAVVAVLAGWAVAQYPYLLPTSLTIAAGAGAPGTLAWVLVVFAVAAVTVAPALVLLFVLDRRGRLLEHDQTYRERPAR